MAGVRAMPRRRRAWIALAVALVMLPLAVAGLFDDRHSKSAALDRELSSEAREQAGNLSATFERGRALTALLGRNPTFRAFYDLPGTRAQRIRRGGAIVRENHLALADLENLFPTSIGEACFIDRHGAENARAVAGRIAPNSDLSPDETKAPFFDPAFALRPGQVFQPRPYISPDTRDWVIANATQWRRT